MPFRAGLGEPDHYQAFRVPTGLLRDGGIWLWGSAGEQLELWVARHCSELKFEGTRKVVTLRSEPTQYVVTHPFQSAHGCARLQLGAIDEPVTLHSWGATLERRE